MQSGSSILKWGILSAALLAGTTSCNKFLEEKPRTEYTAGDFFVDKTTLDAGVVGIYSSAKDLFGAVHQHAAVHDAAGH